MPACSIVIPVYNSRGDLGRSIGSVLRQTLADFELIVVDDGSTDGSGELARKLGDRRLRLISQPNAGVAAARNRGVVESSAGWIAFLDADDAWRPRFLERALGFAAAQPRCTLVFSNTLNVRDGGPWLSLPFERPRVVEDYLQLVLDNGGRGLQTSSALVSREAFLKVGGFPVGVKRSEDIDTWLRLALAGPFGCVPEVLTEFHNEASGVTRRLPEPFYPEIVNTLRRLRLAGGHGCARTRQFRRLEALSLLTYARDLSDYGRRAAARALLRRECRWRDCPPADLARTLLKSLGADTPPPRPRALKA